MASTATKPKAKPKTIKTTKQTRIETPEMPIVTTTIELWEMMPQNLRDAMAVRVLFEQYGRPVECLMLLGFDIMCTSPGGFTIVDKQLVADLVPRVLMTDGTKALLAVDLQNLEENRQAVVARQTQIALHGTDEASSRAAQFVGKVGGWGAEHAPQTPTAVINLWGLVAGQQDTNAQRRVRTIDSDTPLAGADPIAILSHEPGPAVRISSDDAIDELLDHMPAVDAYVPAPDDNDDEDEYGGATPGMEPFEQGIE